MDIANLQDGLEGFERDTGRFPTAAEGLEALVDQPDLLWRWKGPYFRHDRFPRIDPWDRPYVYTPPAAESRVLAATSLGPDGKAGTADDIVVAP
jgi:general secretion pathway protein G